MGIVTSTEATKCQLPSAAVKIQTCDAEDGKHLTNQVTGQISLVGDFFSGTFFL